MARKIVSFIIVVLMLACNRTLTLAYESTGSLKINTDYEGMTIKLYKVANIIDDSFKLSDTYKDYKINIDVETTEEQLALASTLETYITIDEIKENFLMITDKNGDAFFPSLEIGLYLVVSEPLIVDDICYCFAPFLISVPQNINDNLSYAVDSKPKSNIIKEELFDHISVFKIWNGEIKTNSVNVELYCDGKYYDSIVLNAENGWRYTWTNLPYNHDWNILEKDIPNNYTVTYQKKDDSIIIENTYVKQKNPDNPDKDKIPQTGQLWWPVPILTALGLLCLGLGVYKKHEE